MLYAKRLLKESILLRVQRGLKIGMVLFIVSEIMFFFCFFLGIFSFKLSSKYRNWFNFGHQWVLSRLILGVFLLLNTFILLLSGVTITYCHHALLVGSAVYVVDGFFIYNFVSFSFYFFTNL